MYVCTFSSLSVSSITNSLLDTTYARTRKQANKRKGPVRETVDDDEEIAQRNKAKPKENCRPEKAI